MHNTLSSTSYSKRNFHCDYVTIQKLFKMMWSEYFNPLREYTMPRDAKMIKRTRRTRREREKNWSKNIEISFVLLILAISFLDTSGLWLEMANSSHSHTVQPSGVCRQCICRCQLIAYMIPLSYPKHFDLMHLLLSYSMGSGLHILLHQANKRTQKINKDTEREWK